MALDFKFTAEQEAFRAEIQTFLAKELPSDHWQLQSDREHSGEGQAELTRTFVKKLAEQGWLTMHWPKEYGGRGASVMEQVIYNEETGYAAAPVGIGSQMAVTMAGPTIMKWGSEDLKAEHLPAISRGEELWCQGFSETNAGSDLASLETRAVRDGDDYVVNGQKIWTSGAHTADWCMLMVRTDPDVRKHKGITYLLMDMRSPGVEVKPIISMMDAHGFNEVWMEDVRVPARNRVGDENEGWYVGTTTLDFERSGITRVAWSKRVLEEMVGWVRGNGAVTNREVTRNALSDLWIGIEASRLLSYRVGWMQSQGQVPNAEASMVKVFGSELACAITNVGTNLLGLGGGLLRGSAGAPPLYGALPLGYMGTTTYAIAAGTSEIQRNIIAQRGLGLPRQ